MSAILCLTSKCCMGGNDNFKLAAATEWLAADGVVAVAVVVGVDSCSNTIMKDTASISGVCKKSGIVYMCVYINRC